MANLLRVFGLAQDGTKIRLAHLTADKERIIINDLEKIFLPDTEVPVSPDTALEETLDDFDFDFDLGSDTSAKSVKKEEEIKDDDTSYDIFGEEHQKKEPVKEVVEEETPQMGKNLDDVAAEYGFERGTLALNLDVSNITYKELSLPAKSSKKKIQNSLKKIFYDKESPSVMTFSYVSRQDGSVLGVSHEKKMDLLEHIINVNRAISKKRYHYSLIQTNEFALINAMRFNYDIKPDEITALIYIGHDYSRITLTKGYDFFLDMPIINEGSKSKDAIKTIISRFMLEVSHINISAVHNYFLAGEGLSEKTFELFYDRIPNANVRLLLPLKLMEMNDYSDKWDNFTLAEFIIPIMLAVNAALPKDHSLIKSNFLPKQLREQQNLFSISTEGFMVLGLILITALVGINVVLKQQTDNSRMLLEISKTNSQIQVSKTVMDSIYIIAGQIENIEKNIARSNNLVGSRNQWHFIMEKIAKNFQQNHLSWLLTLRGQSDTFRLTGKTTNRVNIISLSKLFPDAVIHIINEEKIQNNTVWHYEISYTMPNPLETKRINYLRETGFDPANEVEPKPAKPIIQDIVPHTDLDSLSIDIDRSKKIELLPWE